MAAGPTWVGCGLWSASTRKEVGPTRLLELAFDDTFVKSYHWSSISQAYSRVLHDQDFLKRVAIDVYCNG